MKEECESHRNLGNMTHVYLDWNVFDKIEKIPELDDEEKQIYSQIENLIVVENLIAPYSNAHINDLIRGYNKNPIYIPQHLNTLQRLTENLCIVQYWGQKEALWHFRDPEEFFDTAINDVESSFESYEDLFKHDVTGLMKPAAELMKFVPVPENFKEIYKANPIFSAIYPKTRTEMTMYALCEDIFNFSKNAKKDYNLYKTLRSFVNQSRAKMKKQEKMFKELDKSMSGIPSHLDFDSAWETQAAKTKTSDNPIYQRVTDTYFRIDFKGFKSDEKFSNMIDDALHVFYGAHCDCFVTLDDKCHYKAIETYKHLGIQTKVFKPNEFIEMINEKTETPSS